MSASLVGSEMCIRDSLHPGAMAPPQGCTHPARGPTTGRRESDGTSPVSYTHLTLPTICSV
eukprot:8210959-Alexandrium_andersonii.AAC.1